MEVVMQHLQRDRKSGFLSYRRRFPLELVPHIPSKSPTGRGRTELKVSLGSASAGDAEARKRYEQADQEFERIVARARRMASRSYDQLDAPLIAFMSETYRHDLLLDDENMRWSTPQAKPTYVTRGDPEEVYEDCRPLLETYDGEGLAEYWGDWACDFADALGYLVSRSDPQFTALAKALGEAACEVWLAVDKRIDDHSVATPASPTRPVQSITTSKSVRSAGHIFQFVADTIMQSALEPIGPSTISSWSTALRFWREVHGTPAVNTIDRLMVTEWLELLRQRPAKLDKPERKLPLREVIERYEERSEVERVSLKTLRGHLASLATIWNKAQERGLIDDGLANPFKARKALAGGSQKRGPEFTIDELQAIFDLPIFSSGERPVRGRGEACYWLPLLLLWTGARPEEIAQLLVSDFAQDEGTNEWAMTITDEGVHPVKGKRSLKTERKGDSGRRTFQVPAPLIELGLLDYLDHLRREGQEALFPRLTVKNKRGLLIPSIADWWAPYIREKGVVLLGVARRPLRDFRQSWATAARRSEIPEDAMSYLMGHSNSQAPMTRRYGKLDANGRWMAKVDYPGLDLSRVRRWVPTPV